MATLIESGESSHVTATIAYVHPADFTPGSTVIADVLVRLGELDDPAGEGWDVLADVQLTGFGAGHLYRLRRVSGPSDGDEIELTKDAVSPAYIIVSEWSGLLDDIAQVTADDDPGDPSTDMTLTETALADGTIAIGSMAVRGIDEIVTGDGAPWANIGYGQAGPSPTVRVQYRTVDELDAATLHMSSTTGTDGWMGVLTLFGDSEGTPTPDPEDPPPAYVPPEPARALVEIYVPEEGAARWGEALWGVDTWSSSVWTSITEQSVTLDASWGTDRPEAGILAPPVAGKWTLTTYDPDRKLDPANQDSPFYPHIRSLLPIRFSHNGYVVRRGHVDRVQYRYADDSGLILATDNIALLAAASVPEDTLLPDTLWARAAAAIAASGAPVPIAAPRLTDPAVAPWDGGNFTAWAIILSSAQEIGYVPYLTNEGMLHFRAWDDPIDRDAEIAAPELIELSNESADDGLVSVVFVNDDVSSTTIERRITPLPRYGERVHRRTLLTLDGEAYADRVLADRATASLRWRPGAVRPLDAAAVEWYARREINELVTLLHEYTEPTVEARTRILGTRVVIRDRGGRLGPSWRFYFACSTEALEPLLADATGLEPGNLYLIDDDTGEYLYPDGVSTVED